MSSGSTGTWSRNSSISCAVVPTTSGIAARYARPCAAGEQVAVDPRMERHHADLRQRRLDHGLVLRGEQRVDGGVAQVVDVDATPAASRKVSATHSAVGGVERARGRAALQDRARHREVGVARREQVRDAAGAGRLAHEHDPVGIAAERGARSRATTSTAARRSRSPRFDGTPVGREPSERAEPVVQPDDHDVVRGERARRRRAASDAPPMR